MRNNVKPGEWSIPKTRFKDVRKRHRNYGETVMFPSSHDITVRNRQWAYSVLSSLLRSGNQVLIVTKPNLAVTKEIVDNFRHYRDQIIYRFTITSLLDSDLKQWEPGAPRFQERLDSLKYAFNENYTTSVSVEPMLNAETAIELFYTLEPYVNETIWFGKMEHQDDPHIGKIAHGKDEPVTYNQIKEIYKALKNEPKVRWKTGTKPYFT